MMKQSRTAPSSPVVLLLITLFSTLAGSSSATRHAVYKVESHNEAPSSLRGGNALSRHRIDQRMEDPPINENRSSDNKKRDLESSNIRELQDVPFPELVEHRRYKAMEAIFEAEEMLFALRFSLSMSMGVPSAPVGSSTSPEPVTAPPAAPTNPPVETTPSPVANPIDPPATNPAATNIPGQSPTISPVGLSGSPEAAAPPIAPSLPPADVLPPNPTNPPGTNPPGTPTNIPVTPSLPPSDALPPNPTMAPLSTPTLVPDGPPGSPEAATGSPAFIPSEVVDPPTESPVAPSIEAPTARPTAAGLCNGLTSEERAELLEEQVLSISGILSLVPGSAQDEAYQWLAFDDELQVCPDDEVDVLQRYVMSVLYFETEGDGWKNCAAASASNNSPCPTQSQRFLSRSDVCLWLHITCARGSITRLSIDENNLSGRIPEELGELALMEVIDFDSNENIVGSIPESFGSLSLLRILDLDTNQISGSIPDSLYSATTLEAIDLDGNMLTGTLSPRLADLSALRVLMLHENMMIGTLPSEIGELDQLTYLMLDNNNFEGPIPSTYSNLEDLEALTLQGNVGINGTIPAFLGNFTGLRFLQLHNTNMVGTIPSQLGQLMQAQVLNFHSSNFSGIMPTAICNLRTLDPSDGKKLIRLTADCAGPNPKVVCAQPSCCSACF